MTEIASIAPSTPRLGPADAAASAAVPAASVAPVPATTRPASEAPPPDALQPAEQSKRALQAQIDRVLANTQTTLRFRVDEETDRVVVSVLDRRGEVILQVPNETALTLARRLASTGSLVEAKA
ncbi:flagellar protein FlaG [Lysobacter korlensis]|uniref:Flagellar protein FlaG n=1 Tax=Lysobacter korlensis TaxID=553636 RepID=A0ABV6RJC3_9GAMM